MPTKPFTIFLALNGHAEEAAKFYTSVFKDSKLGATKYYGEAGKEHHGSEPGSVVSVAFELNGQQFVGVNAKPHLKHSHAVSFRIECEDQEEVDYYWDKLSEGGDESRQISGFTADKYGVGWQIIPKALNEVLSGDDEELVAQATTHLMGKKKLDLAHFQSVLSRA
ncbi:hypothetical protein HJFPF1_13041 [Paramyrothecium foliicola]|nr:hypothetical protein HJFPF1_13041 [Paramyrothecium foliicola]